MEGEAWEEREGWVDREGWKERIGRKGLGGECRRRGRKRGVKLHKEETSHVHIVHRTEIGGWEGSGLGLWGLRGE